MMLLPWVAIIVCCSVCAPVSGGQTYAAVNKALSAMVQITDLPGKGSYPTEGCSIDDCWFYFRWGVNSTDPRYITFYINADITRGWAAIGVSPDRRMGGPVIDDVFGCRSYGNGTVEYVDTHNYPGGPRFNVKDTKQGAPKGYSHQPTGMVDGRMECTFSRVISVLRGDEDEDLNLNASYYVFIGAGSDPGTEGFPFHDHDPEISTTKVNLAMESSAPFYYARGPLIKTHGALMVLAWPIFAWLGIAMARHMRPALPNGRRFLLHRIFLVCSLICGLVGFVLIFVAYRNVYHRGLVNWGSGNKVGSAHLVIGIIVMALQIINPIIALVRCDVNSKRRWIFNLFHGVLVGTGVQILSGVQILLGLYLFGQFSHKEYDAFYVMLALVVLFGAVDFLLYIIFSIVKCLCVVRTNPLMPKFKVGYDQYGTMPSSQPVGTLKMHPSQDYWIRWIGWLSLAVINVVLGIIIIGLVVSS